MTLNNQYGPLGSGTNVGSVGDFSPGRGFDDGPAGGAGERGSTSSPIVISAQARNSSWGPQPTAPKHSIKKLQFLFQFNLVRVHSLSVYDLFIYLIVFQILESFV